MNKETKSLIWGIILILIGFLFLGNNLNWFRLEWSDVWPLFMIVGGLLFWLGWMVNRKETGLLMPGTILLAYGFIFQYCVLYGWYWMDELWPVFLLGPGLGFFFMYLLGQREKELLIPGSILTGLAILFWIGRDMWRFFWPLLFIGVGIYLLLKPGRMRRKNRVSDEINISESKEKN